MFKKLLLSIIFISILNSISFGQKGSFEWNRKNNFDFGYQIASPYLRNGAQNVGMWEGRYVDVKGLFTAGMMRGTVSTYDSNKVIFANGLFCYFGGQYSHSFFKNNFF